MGEDSYGMKLFVFSTSTKEHRFWCGTEDEYYMQLLKFVLSDAHPENSPFHPNNKHGLNLNERTVRKPKPAKTKVAECRLISNGT